MNNEAQIPPKVMAHTTKDTQELHVLPKLYLFINNTVGYTTKGSLGKILVDTLKKTVNTLFEY